jgi:hypothetical protein
VVRPPAAFESQAGVHRPKVEPSEQVAHATQHAVRRSDPTYVLNASVSLETMLLRCAIPRDCSSMGLRGPIEQSTHGGRGRRIAAALSLRCSPQAYGRRSELRTLSAILSMA